MEKRHEVMIKTLVTQNLKIKGKKGLSIILWGEK
jgi:hypothetical protein